MIAYVEKDAWLLFTVQVVPRASQSRIEGEHNGALRVRIAARPVDGAANEELVRTLARGFKVSPSEVQITSGHAAKMKQVGIRGGTPEILLAFALLVKQRAKAPPGSRTPKNV